MSSPQQQGGIPPELKNLIDQYIKDETERILTASQPEAPKPLTPAEQARLLLVRVAQLEAGEKARPSYSGPTHDAIARVLALLVDAAWPVTTPPSDAVTRDDAAYQATGE
jgi:hypothetical protein